MAGYDRKDVTDVAIIIEVERIYQSTLFKARLPFRGIHNSLPMTDEVLIM